MFHSLQKIEAVMSVETLVFLVNSVKLFAINKGISYAFSKFQLESCMHGLILDTLRYLY